MCYIMQSSVKCAYVIAICFVAGILFAIFYPKQKGDTDVKRTSEKCTAFNTSGSCIPLRAYLALNRAMHYNVKDPKNKISLDQCVCNISTFPPLNEEEDRPIWMNLTKEVNKGNRLLAQVYDSHPPSDWKFPGTAKIGDFPHVCLLRYSTANKRYDKCPCSILNHNSILTAYSCLSAKGLKSLYVVVGIVDRTENESSNYEYKLKNSLHHHPLFDPMVPVLDVVILHTESSIKFSSRILPIDLPEKPFYPTLAVACGWGTDLLLDEPFDILRKVILEFCSPEECSELYNDRDENNYTLHSDYVNPLDITLSQRYDPEYHMFYWDPTGANATTEGDYGGPLQCVVDGRYVLIGITQPAVSPLLPGLYLDVYRILAWIVKTAWPQRYQELVDTYRLEQLAAACNKKSN